MAVVRLVLDVECEVDDLGAMVSEEEARGLAILKVFHRLARGTLVLVACSGSLETYAIVDDESRWIVGGASLTADPSNQRVTELMLADGAA